MNELVKMVQERQEQIARHIAQHETGIEQLQAEAKKLDAFLSLARELFDKTPESAPEPKPVATSTAAAAPATAAPQQAPVQKEAPRVLPSRQSAENRPPSQA